MVDPAPLSRGFLEAGNGYVGIKARMAGLTADVGGILGIDICPLGRNSYMVDPASIAGGGSETGRLFMGDTPNKASLAVLANGWVGNDTRVLGDGARKVVPAARVSGWVGFDRYAMVDTGGMVEAVADQVVYDGVKVHELVAAGKTAMGNMHSVAGSVAVSRERGEWVGGRHIYAG